MSLDKNADTPANVSPKDPLRRLLLCEVLIEEYESLEQPALDPTELSLIKQEIEAHHVAYQGRSDEARTDADNDLNGRLVKRIYKLMSEAQRRETHDNAESLSNKYKDLFSNLYNPSPEDLTKLVDRAVIADIYGHVDELKAKYETEHISETDDAKRKEKVEASMYKALHDEALGSPVVAGSTTSTSVEKPQSQNGREQKDPGITRRQAERVAAGTLRSALCLSGGGIRSATFNLGILQGLARHGLLQKFDYLSTVSGGGFIGGWLSAWIRRDGIDDVMKKLSAPPKSPLEVEPGPLEHLRIYSNYLSPQPGLLSADTWTLVASVLRNLLLNWVIFLPVLFAFLMLPRLWTAVLFRSTDESRVADPYWRYSIPISLIIAAASGIWAMIYIGWNLPSANAYQYNPKSFRFKGGQGTFIRRCLIWLVISAASLSIFLWASRKSGNIFSWNDFPVKEAPLTSIHFIVFAELLILPGLIVCIIKAAVNMRRNNVVKGGRFYASLVLVSALIVSAQALIAYLAIVVVSNWLRVSDVTSVRYAIFSVPVLLLLMVLGAILIAGLSSWLTNDDDQEWWARAGAWVFIVLVAWIVVIGLVVYGPLLILTPFEKIRQQGFSSLTSSDTAKLLGTLMGVISGAVTLIGGFSATTPANAKEAQKAGIGGKLLGLLTTLLAPLFLAFVIILISLATDWILTSGAGQYLGKLIDEPVPYVANLSIEDWHIRLIEATPFRLVALLIGLLVLLVFFLGPFISTNVFSLQFLWRNRIIRAYLGASNRERRPNHFTGFDTYDNIQMHELRKQPADVPQPPVRAGREDFTHPAPTKKLLHVLNLALNLTGGEKLQWQDRRAESFTVSPLHAGSYWLGYRRSFCYGGREGISLGAAIAISGAFVSPNMGFMMTSPVVRFLMALFNVRFGAWLGNPGLAGDKPKIRERILTWPAKLLRGRIESPFQLASPTLSVLPFIDEAFGNIDDKSAYVYLSDGGHFENLGLYEMVLRRCRFIIVSDASTDPDYSFQSLAMSVRQIRVDLGIPIELPELSVTNPAQDMRNKYCAIGTIKYSCVDRVANDPNTRDKDFDGVLIYIKPSLIGEEPRDIINYWQDRRTFPQEVITDQWFSEAQFESYRALGSYIIDAICGGESRNPVNFAAFAAKARDHNQLDFRAFREQISYLALAQEFKTGLRKASLQSYRSKVRQFMERLLK